MSRYRSLSVPPKTYELLLELKRLNGKPHVRQVDDLVKAELKRERERREQEQAA